MATLVLTVIGNDRSGLVDALSDVIESQGGNWTKSQMAELGGKFAGIVMVTVPDINAASFEAALEPLTAQGLLDITVMAIEASGVAPTEAGMARNFELSLLGPDQPGIVHDVSKALADNGVSIAELRTELREAPMAGGMLFEAHALLEVPPGLPADELKDCVEALEAELMVDIELKLEQDEVPGEL